LESRKLSRRSGGVVTGKTWQRSLMLVLERPVSHDGAAHTTLAAVAKCAMHTAFLSSVGIPRSQVLPCAAVRPRHITVANGSASQRAEGSRVPCVLPVETGLTSRKGRGAVLTCQRSSDKAWNGCRRQMRCSVQSSKMDAPATRTSGQSAKWGLHHGNLGYLGCLFIDS
jgi:hypothetical protein